MLMDYADLSKALKAIHDRFDHTHLNESLDVDSPTSEFLARWIYEYLNTALPGKVSRVLVSETCTSECIYEP